MKKVEFHVHTIASKDSLMFKWIILLLCKVRHIDCLAITDHNEIWYAKKNVSFFKKHNIDIIVGEEIFSSDGEIIGLFLNTKIKKGLSAIDTVKEIKKQNGIVYIPHPFDEKRRKTVIKKEALELIKKDVDFIEIHNGRNISDKYDIEQFKIQNELCIKPIIGSDSHTFFELGRNFVYVDYNSLDDFKSNIDKIICEKNFSVKKCIKFAHVLTKIDKGIKMIGKGDFIGLFKNIFKRRRDKNK